MSEQVIYDLWRNALTTTIMVAAPFIVLALVVGLVMAVVQAATQLQENVLTFVPKLAALALVLTVAGPWALAQLTRYTERTAEAIAHVGAEQP
ncbi:MAG TPA: flagellar biosynthetic protein FliQ [Polyangia bacterium]|nr:flagellar biosynthetic protein FliQ [Polyangia bacterium]HWE29738.1 flagellar biosynthetic protein FliQ [Polyangia bacterium]